MNFVMILNGFGHEKAKGIAIELSQAVVLGIIEVMKGEALKLKFSVLNLKVNPVASHHQLYDLTLEGLDDRKLTVR